VQGPGARAHGRLPGRASAPGVGRREDTRASSEAKCGQEGDLVDGYCRLARRDGGEQGEAHLRAPRHFEILLDDGGEHVVSLLFAVFWRVA
jgi:hypothetical protein